MQVTTSSLLFYPLRSKQSLEKEGNNGSGLYLGNEI